MNSDTSGGVTACAVTPLIIPPPGEQLNDVGAERPGGEVVFTICGPWQTGRCSLKAWPRVRSQLERCEALVLVQGAPDGRVIE